jgi:hypothetical protein
MWHFQYIEPAAALTGSRLPCIGREGRHEVRPSLTVNTQVLAEILSVSQHGGRIWLLRPRGVESWLVETRDAPTSDVVVSALDEHGLKCVAVHSTSWRQTPKGLLLTYVAALLDSTPDLAQFEWACVCRAELALGDACHPSSSITVDQVIEHGLRHLSWLAGREAEISRGLGPVWRRALSAYQPEPFQAL